MRGERVRRKGLAAGICAALGASVLAACMGGGTESELSKGLNCVDDSQACVAERSAALRALMQDKSQGWVRQQPTPAAYASGVRLFAFKQRKRELSCEDLGIGRREADAGPGVLRGPGGAGLTPAQVSRGVMLSGEVSRELEGELRRRCRG
jgi:hypothetical protein